MAHPRKKVFETTQHCRDSPEIITISPRSDDPIYERGEELAQSIQRNPYAFMRYADVKLHVSPSSDAAEC